MQERKKKMPDSEMGSDANREELVRRVELIEAMIAEGRRFTGRFGWIFVLWGVVDLAAMSWQFFAPNSELAGTWAWPICLAAGAALTILGVTLRSRGAGHGKSLQCRSVQVVWAMMGVAMALYVASAMVRHLTWQYSYEAAILMIVGLAHAISAAILRWRVQGVVAGIWWAGGVATFFARSWRDVRILWLIEMCFGMVLFGLYVMFLERRRAAGERHGGDERERL
jgi:hypothetical protein